MKQIAIVVSTLALAASPAAAQQNSNSAGQIVSQPARDVGAEKIKIPPVLIKASEAPYSIAGVATCAAIGRQITALTAELGPDYGATPAEQDKVEQLAAAGGRAVVNSIIPFRGLVREVSGAAAADRRLQAAVDAGLARRGFLRGLQQAKGCRR
ncbi:hypothetical protein [Sphingomonas sp.]|uniref:hypothetical protein n=1 Tax=Sphingomonas sp. TaxID=28214 RepID=UPI002C686838|nr:hypothetical protein [Sphingomonas sp.]HWK35506.1 hypothetical protein [Sphingomonas sp.]